MLVEFAASGSGKSVDLAGSSVSRGAHLTIVMSLEDDKSNKEFQFQASFGRNEALDRAEKRNSASFVLLDAYVRRIRRQNIHLANLCKMATVEARLCVVVAIDETSRCPLIVGSIISDVPAAETAVATALGVDEMAIAVMFSIIGTGAAKGCVGSNLENYETVEPSARSSTIHAKLCDYLLGEDLEAIFPGETTPKKVTAKAIAEKRPVLWTLMENGRMASIAAANLRHEVDKSSPLVEAALVSDIVLQYMESNAMKDLVSDKLHEAQRMVGACALAVDLFQWKESGEGPPTPAESEPFAAFMATMECGVLSQNEFERS